MGPPPPSHQATWLLGGLRSWGPPPARLRNISSLIWPRARARGSDRYEKHPNPMLAQSDVNWFGQASAKDRNRTTGARSKVGQVANRYPAATTERVARSMRSNRSRDTALEIRIRSALFAAGLRYRKHVRPVSGLRYEADVVFARHRLVVFIDGCFWHGCPDHHRRPLATASNRDWWLAKLQTNAERDRKVDALLSEQGWTVLRIWEHESDDDAVQKVVARLRALGRSA